MGSVSLSNGLLEKMLREAATLSTPQAKSRFLMAQAESLEGLALKELLLITAKIIEPSNPKEADTILGEIIKLGLGCPSVHLGRSIVQHNLGEFRESVESLKAAMAMELDASQKSMASLMLVKFGQLGLASSLARQAFHETQDRTSVAANCLDVAMSAADWDFYEELIPYLRQLYLSGNFFDSKEAAKTNILWCTDEYTNIKISGAWAQRTYPHFLKNPNNQTKRRDKKRIRVGYLSSDYRTHPTAFLINGLLSNHDRLNFEIFGYCTGWDDGSDIRKTIISHCDHFFSLTGQGDEEAASLISSHELDVLVELNGATKSNRLGILSYRPCQNQICYLGWPGSVGGRFVDYIVADDYILSTQKSELYPEKIIWLDGTYQVNDHRRLGPLTPIARGEYNLPPDRPILGMFNTINKVNRQVWSVWMEILRRVPEAVFWLLDPGPDVRTNLAKEASRWGIELDRVIIAPRLPFEKHIRRLQLCDLVIDPWPIGGHTSAADALYAGVPLVVMKGSTYASRVGGSLLRAAGLECLVQDNQSEYLDFVVAMLENPEELAHLKKLMSKNIGSSSLFDSGDKARQFEAVYSELVRSPSNSGSNVQGDDLSPKKRFAICIFYPEGYVHHRAFEELCEVLCYGLRDLGHHCVILQNQFSTESVNILLGVHLIPEQHHSKFPNNSIILNTEPLDSIREDWAGRILSLSHALTVWDYSEKNVDLFVSRGLPAPSIFEFGYQPQLDRIPLSPRRDIDILFYGSLNERRKAIIAELEGGGLRVTCVFGVYGTERDALISRSRIVLNLKASELNSTEVVRISYLLMNGVAVVSELVQGQHSATFAEKFIEHFDRHTLAAGLRRLLADEPRLERLRANARRAFGGRSQSQNLRSLLYHRGEA